MARVPESFDFASSGTSPKNRYNNNIINIKYTVVEIRKGKNKLKRNYKTKKQ